LRDALAPGLPPEVEDVVQSGSKDGALLPHRSTSPSSARRTGRATRRGTRLASNLMSRFSMLTRSTHLDDAADGMENRAA
jgi:hypothetical protein